MGINGPSSAIWKTVKMPVDLAILTMQHIAANRQKNQQQQADNVGTDGNDNVNNETQQQLKLVKTMTFLVHC